MQGNQIARLFITLLVIGFMGSACTSAPQSNPAPTTAVTPEVVDVEYARIEGEPCLQPKAIRGTPTDVDLIAAQKRWLAEQYPGYRLTRQTHFLTLAPEYRRPEEKDAPTRPFDSLQFQTADGKPISVCFALLAVAPQENQK